MIQVENSPDLLLTPPEAADRLRVSIPTLYRYVSSGRLAAVRLGPNGVLRVPVAALAKFVEQA